MRAAILPAINKHFAMMLLVVLTCISLCACSLLRSGPVATRITEHPDPPVTPYIIGKDDILNVVVWREPEISGKTRVNTDGTITVPLAGTVPAAGRSCTDLQADLTNRLSKFTQQPNVTVSVVEARSQVFYALGEVKKPGVYPLGAGEVLSQALAEAGGLTDFADAGAVRVVRHKPTADVEVVVNYNSVSKGKDLNADIGLEPGDTITVP
jgi:polysaccharide biosynthesis/export protein